MPPVPGFETRPRGTIGTSKTRGGTMLPDGPADHRAQGRPPRRAAADALDESRSVTPISTSTTPGRATGRRGRRPWCRGLRARAPRTTRPRARRSAGWRKRLDVVDDRGLAEEPDSTGTAAGPGLRAPPLDRLEQRGLLAEDEAARAAPQLDGAGERRARARGRRRGRPLPPARPRARAAPPRDRPRRGRRG